MLIKHFRDVIELNKNVELNENAIFSQSQPKIINKLYAALLVIGYNYAYSEQI